MSSALAGSSVLALFGINPIPMGTPDELRKVGVDPGLVGSCAPPNPDGGVRGCPLWKSCPFHLPKYGGFKGQGPKYVGYYIKTTDGKQQENFMTCHNFVRVLLHRKRAGERHMEEGKPNYELIQIIAQEGGTVRQRGSYKVDPADRTPTARWEIQTKHDMVPTWPRPGSRSAVTYEAELWADAQKRLMAEDSVQPEFTGPPVEPDMSDEDFTLDMDANADPGLAEPVEKKKK